MRHKIILIILSVFIFIGIGDITQATTGMPAVSSTGSLSSSGTTSFLDSFLASSIEYVKVVYSDVYDWYHRYNKPTTILPEILRVSIIDFFGVILGVLLMFWIMIRALSR